jgi:hypothetical protein
MQDGQGVANLIPPFLSDVFKKNRSSAVCHIIYGIIDSTGDRLMPAFNRYSDAQIANILNFISKNQAFDSPFYNEKEIANARQNCKQELLQE